VLLDDDIDSEKLKNWLLSDECKRLMSATMYSSFGMNANVLEYVNKEKFRNKKCS